MEVLFLVCNDHGRTFGSYKHLFGMFDRQNVATNTNLERLERTALERSL